MSSPKTEIRYRASGVYATFPHWPSPPGKSEPSCRWVAVPQIRLPPLEPPEVAKVVPSGENAIDATGAGATSVR